MLEFSGDISMFVQNLWSRVVSRISLQLRCPTLGKGTSSIKGDMFSLPKWYWNHGLEATGAHEALVLTHLIQRFLYRFGRAIVAKALAANKKCTNEAYHMKQRSHTDLLWTTHLLYPYETIRTCMWVGEFLDLFESMRHICNTLGRSKCYIYIYIVSWGLSKIVYPTEWPWWVENSTKKNAY